MRSIESKLQASWSPEQIAATETRGEVSFKTATTDRGKEFACYAPIEKEIGLRLYFLDACSSWQRGSNENANGLLREFYPKQTDLALVDEKQLQVNLKLINSRPRKCLDRKTPI